MNIPYWICKDKIPIEDFPVLNEQYDLPAPHSKYRFETFASNKLRTYRVLEKFNFHDVHLIEPWHSICNHVQRVLQDAGFGDLKIRSSWINAYLSEGDAAEWHNHPEGITTLLFLNDHSTPLELSAGYAGSFDCHPDEIVVTDTIETIAGTLVALPGSMVHRVPAIKEPGRWTLTTNFFKGY